MADLVAEALLTWGWSRVQDVALRQSDSDSDDADDDECAAEILDQFSHAVDLLSDSTTARARGFAVLEALGTSRGPGAASPAGLGVARAAPEPGALAAFASAELVTQVFFCCTRDCQRLTAALRLAAIMNQPTRVRSCVSTETWDCLRTGVQCANFDSDLIIALEGWVDHVKEWPGAAPNIRKSQLLPSLLPCVSGNGPKVPPESVPPACRLAMLAFEGIDKLEFPGRVLDALYRGMGVWARRACCKPDLEPAPLSDHYDPDACADAAEACADTVAEIAQDHGSENHSNVRSVAPALVAALLRVMEPAAHTSAAESKRRPRSFDRLSGMTLRLARKFAVSLAGLFQCEDESWCAGDAVRGGAETALVLLLIRGDTAASAKAADALFDLFVRDYRPCVALRADSRLRSAFMQRLLELLSDPCRSRQHAAMCAALLAWLLFQSPAARAELTAPALPLASAPEELLPLPQGHSVDCADCFSVIATSSAALRASLEVPRNNDALPPAALVAAPRDALAKKLQDQTERHPDRGAVAADDTAAAASLACTAAARLLQACAAIADSFSSVTLESLRAGFATTGEDGAIVLPAEDKYDVVVSAFQTAAGAALAAQALQEAAAGVLPCCHLLRQAVKRVLMMALRLAPLDRDVVGGAGAADAHVAIPNLWCSLPMCMKSAAFAEMTHASRHELLKQLTDASSYCRDRLSGMDAVQGDG